MSHPLTEVTDDSPKARLMQWREFGRKPLMQALSLSFLDMLTTVGFAWSLSRILGHLLTGRDTGSGLYTALLALIASLALKAILGQIIQRLNIQAARDIIRNIRADITRKVFTGQGLSATHAVKLSSLFEDSEALEGYYSRFYPARVLAASVPLILIGVIALKSPLSALILLGTLCPFVALMALSGLTTVTQSRQQLDALSRLSNLFADRVRALPLILSFDNGPQQTATVGRAAREVSERTLSVLKIAFTASAILEFFSALAVALIAVYCGFALLNLLPFAVPAILDFKSASVFEAAFFALALSPEVFAPMRRLSAAYHDQQTAMAATERLIELTKTLPETPKILTVATPPAIRFEAVVARFVDDPDYRIGPVSFTAAPQSVTALIGPTGSGKSTLLRRLLNPSEPFDGQIFINDQPLTAGVTIAPQVAWISQTTPILAGTIRENLSLSQADLSDDHMRDILDLTGVSKIIASRQGGLDHRLDERGSGLSGGERRRLGLARALLKPAPILILDEPTADLDAESEADILRALQWGFRGSTVIMATHSEKLISLADQVVSL